MNMRWVQLRWVQAVAAVLLVCTGTWAWLSTTEEPTEGVPRHVVLIVIDTLRADVVDEVDTPVFDALAEEGDSADRAWSSGTWTAPSVISIFSGMPVRSHGWDFPFPAKMDNRTNSYSQIPDVPLLAEVLNEAGFQTSAFYGNRLLSQGLGYDRGFDSFRGSGDRKLADRIEGLLDQQDLDQRQFIYLHMFGGHQPLRPSRESARKWNVDPKLVLGRGFPLQVAKKGNPAVQNQYSQAYRAVVEDIDARLGEVLDALDPIRDDSIIIVTSDHGEMLGEHEHFGHGHWVYEPLTRVPFVAVGVGDLPDTLTLSSVPDLITTALGVEADWPVKSGEEGPLVSQREGKIAFSPDGQLKGIWDPQLENGFAAYDLIADPEETTEIPDVQDELEQARDIWLEETPYELLKPVDGSMTDEMIEALEELGYME